MLQDESDIDSATFLFDEENAAMSSIPFFENHVRYFNLNIFYSI